LIADIVRLQDVQRVDRINYLLDMFSPRQLQTNVTPSYILSILFVNEPHYIAGMDTTPSILLSMSIEPSDSWFHNQKYKNP